MCLWDSSQHAKTRRGFATGGVGKEVSGSLYSTPHFQLFITVVLSASMNHLFFCIGDFLFSHWVVKLRWPFALKFFRLSPQSKEPQSACRSSWCHLCLCRTCRRFSCGFLMKEHPTISNYRIQVCLHLLSYCDHPIKPKIGFWLHLILNPPKIRC